MGHAATAADWNVVLNGRAVHMNAAKQWNESNWGLGIETELNPEARWVKLVAANGFLDSQNHMSYMAGGGIKRRFWSGGHNWHVDIGVIAFLMTRDNVNKNNPFPGALPVLTLGTRYLAVNATYLPDSVVDDVTRADRVDPSMRGVLFFQLKLDWRLFSPTAPRY
jgi:hypothetical protein